ncbi:unnamed protein product [Bemisia tabaci]|uniref:AAA-ATPase-like domain-containing protein n=1 Tax=Bemisia tabaci TaxID=7038 RepID=A0A9P0AMZ4_BEMTA|nr:unnamed protein product [Bemisia tabaci]
MRNPVLRKIILWLTYLMEALTAQHQFPSEEKSEFRRLAEGSNYVDKTLLIEEALEHPRDARLIMAPSGFGKSLHLSMLRDFFQIPMNENGTEQPKEQARSFKIFSSKKIGRSKFFGEFGTRGVVFLDLSILNDFNNLTEYLVKFRRVIQKAFEQHMYLIRDPRSELDAYLNRHIFERCGILDPTLPVNCSTLESCGSDLPQMVKSHVDKGVLLLIDAVSTPFERILDNRNKGVWPVAYTRKHPIGQDDDLDRIIGSLQLFLSSVVKGNHGVWRSYLTAITGFEVPYNESIINVEFASIFTSRKLATGYGFTQEDLEEFISTSGMSAEQKTNLQEYLEGYSIFQKNESEIVGPIYCPGLVTKYLAEDRGKPLGTPVIAVNYSSLRSLTPFKNLLSPKLFGNQIIKSLKPDFEIEIKNNSRIQFENWLRLREAEQTGAIKHFKKNQNIFLLYLLEHGYFRGQYIGKKLSIKISNKIARLSLRDAITKVEYYQEYLGCSDTAIHEFRDSIDSIDGKQNTLNNLIESIENTFWRGFVVKPPKPELEISAPIYTFLVRSSGNERIEEYNDIFLPRPNKEAKTIQSLSGATGFDVVLVKRKNDFGILLGTEFDKRPSTYYASEDISSAPQILQQMIDLQYHTYFAKKMLKNRALISIHINLTHVSCCALYNSYDVNNKLCVEKIVS